MNRSTITNVLTIKPTMTRNVSGFSSPSVNIESLNTRNTIEYNVSVNWYTINRLSSAVIAEPSGIPRFMNV